MHRLCLCVCDANVSAQSHSPNLIAVEFTYVPQEHKLGFGKLKIKNNWQRWVPPLIPVCDELFMCVVCFWKMQSTQEAWEGGVVSHTSMEYLQFTVFTLKMNERILSPEPRSLTIFIPPSSLFLPHRRLPVLSPQRLMDSVPLTRSWWECPGDKQRLSSRSSRSTPLRGSLSMGALVALVWSHPGVLTTVLTFPQ